MLSFAEYLQPLVPHLSPQLVSTQAFSDIHSIASLIPGTLAHSQFGFECRLGEDLPKADFLLCATASLGGRCGLAQLGQAFPLLLTQPVWRQVHNFATHWADASSPLYAHVDDIWLEFDVDGTSSQNPLPSVFFGLQTKHSRDSEQFRAMACADDIATTQIALKLLTGNEILPATLEKLSSCCQMLPSGAQIRFIGAMLARDTHMFRCVIQGMSLGEILDYLRRIEWEGSIGDIKNVFETISSFIDYVWLNIDVGETIGHKIGLECYYNNSPNGEIKQRGSLDYLVQNGLCTNQKRNALLLYSGISYINPNDDLWPESLRLSSQLFGSVGFTMLRRGLHHVKIVYHPQKPLEAKAYLVAEYR